MLIFNNQQKSGYEEIASYSPRYYRRIKEMDAVFRLAGQFADLMAKDMEEIIAFQFLKYMDEEPLTRYEAFLEIENDTGKTLDERRTYIDALLIGSGKLSADKIKTLVNRFPGCTYDDIALVDSTLCVKIIIDEDLDLSIRNNIYNLIKKKLSSHIVLDIAFDNAMMGRVYFGAFAEQADIIDLRQR